MNQRKYKKYLKKKGRGYHMCSPCILNTTLGSLVTRSSVMKQHRIHRDLRTIRRRELRQNAFKRWLMKELRRQYFDQMEQLLLFGEMSGAFADMIPIDGKYTPHAD